MANTALAVLESALRDRKLDRTLTTALPPLEQGDDACAPTGVAAIDACLRNGMPRGQLSELAGPRSSGRTTLLLQMMAAATRRGELAAFVDTFDRLDVASAEAAGVDFGRLLWVRGQSRERGQAARPARMGRRSRAQGAQPRAAGGRLRPGGHRSRRRARHGAAAPPLHDVASGAACRGRPRHRLRARHAGTAGAQCRRHHADPDWPHPLDRLARAAAGGGRRRAPARGVAAPPGWRRGDGDGPCRRRRADGCGCGSHPWPRVFRPAPLHLSEP